MQTHDIPQISRAVVTGFSHHATQRENYQQRLFRTKMISGDIQADLKITLENTS